MDDTNLPGSSPEPAPKRLVEELRSFAHRSPVWVPPAVDASILNAAKEHLAGIPNRTQSQPRTSIRWLRLAAILVAGALISVLALTRKALPESERLADVDGNGQVDILDAFALARRLKEHPESPGAYDVNQDHRVDAADVEAVAARAVELKGDTGS